MNYWNKWCTEDNLCRWGMVLTPVGSKCLHFLKLCFDDMHWVSCINNKFFRNDCSRGILYSKIYGLLFVISMPCSLPFFRLGCPNPDLRMWKVQDLIDVIDNHGMEEVVLDQCRRQFVVYHFYLAFIVCLWLLLFGVVRLGVGKLGTWHSEQW